MKFTISLVTLILCNFGNGLLAQIQNKPLEPTLYYVSVDPESVSGDVVIVWISSPSKDWIEYYRVLQTQPQSNPLQPVVMSPISDNLPVSDTTWRITTGDALSGSVGYSVQAINDPGGRPEDYTFSNWSPPDSTIFVESVFDSCQGTIQLSWNDYNNWRGSIAGYNIYRRLAPGIYELLTTLSEGTNTTVLSNLQANQPYDLFVEAVNNDGRKSTSNRVEVFMRISESPGYMNADYATISPGNNINLSFTVDSVAGSYRYYLLRSENYNGPFTRIDSFSVTGRKVLYTDEVPFTSGIFYYRLQPVNRCGTNAIQSNRANNIILNGSLSGMAVSLLWNEYLDWLGNVQQYQIIRSLGRNNQVIDTIDLAGASTTSFNDDISGMADYQNPMEGLVCYTVKATENPNIYGVQGVSESNRVCFSLNPQVRIPNAFIPNDADPVNQVFEPVFSFLPEHYQMIIYDRLGSKIWEGSQAWDGRSGGKNVPEGVYVYYLRVFNYSADITEFKGMVTVLYR